MFTKESTPFKLFYYHKNIKNSELQTELMLAYNCVYYPYVKMAACIFEDDQIQILKRDRYGKITIDGTAQEGEDKMMRLSNFIDNFRASEGIDFVVLRIPVYFLITRQKENKIKIYMTNSNDYLEVFTDPNKYFDVDDDKINNYVENFDLEYLGVREFETDDDSKHASDYGSKDNSTKMDKKEMTNKEADAPHLDELGDSHCKDGRPLEESMNSLSIDLGTKEVVSDKETEVDSDRTEKSLNGREKIKSPETCMIEIGEPVDDEVFDEYVRANKIRSVIKLGKKSGDVYEFERYPLKDSSNGFLTKIVERFPSGIFDFIEIIGKTKIAGCIKDDRAIWYGELTDQIGDYAEYIKLINSIFKFTVFFEREDSKSNSDEESDKDRKNEDSSQATQSSE